MKTKECEHTRSKKGIFICGSFHEHEGVTKLEHVYICNECGAIYLHRYVHRAAIGSELTFIIMPGEVKNGVKFHEATAALIKAVLCAEGRDQLEAIDRQAVAVRNYVLERLEQMEEEAADANQR